MLKKILLSVSLFIACTLSCAATINAAFSPLTENAGTTVRAQFLSDTTPPSQPILTNPNHNPKDFCQRRPVFTWKESIDNIGVTSYSFTLTDKKGANTFSFHRTFDAPITNADYKVWSENGYWYLQLASDLNWSTYNWFVTASDAAGYTATSSTWSFTLDENTCTFQCDRDSTIDDIQFLSPASGIVDTRKPAIVFTYPETVKPTLLNLIIDDTTIIYDVNLTSTHHTTTYDVYLNTANRKITFQPQDYYLPNKSTTPVSWQIRIKVIDEHGCSYTTDSHTLSLTTDAILTNEALVPTLLTPTIDYSTSTAQINSFSWNICAAADQLASQNVYLNNQLAFTLNNQSLSTPSYDFSVSSAPTSLCQGDGTVFHLTLKDTSLLLVNDPLDLDDWNRWSIQTTNAANLQASSQTWRFRYFPQSLATYSWCTNQNTCVSGTLSECSASGRNCYYNDTAACNAAASVDCSSEPPQKTYYWCQNQSQCVSGTLADCQKTGKNCYLNQSDQSGTGCLQHALNDCDNQASYFWCSTAQTCNLTDFTTCAQSGKPCYRQEEPGQSCPDIVKKDCAPIVATISSDFTGSDRTPLSPLTTLIDVPINSLEILQKLGVSENFIQTLETLSATVFPVFSVILFLPLGLLIIFFPRPKGRVYDHKTLTPVRHALVVVQNEGNFVKAQITDAQGLYTGFKLAPGQYHLQVSHSQFIFPSLAPKNKIESTKNHYLGEKFKVRSEFSPSITYQIPLDFDPQKNPLAPKNDSPAASSASSSIKFSHRFWHAFYSLLNFCTLLWLVSFFCVLIFTLFYPILLNFFVLVIYILGFIRRLFVNLHRVNVTGRVFTSDGHAANNCQLQIDLLAGHRPAATTLTNHRGYFELYLSPAETYVCRSRGHIFSEIDGDTPQIILDFHRDSALNLDLVIKTDPDAQ